MGRGIRFGRRTNFRVGPTIKTLTSRRLYKCTQPASSLVLRNFVRLGRNHFAQWLYTWSSHNATPVRTNGFVLLGLPLKQWFAPSAGNVTFTATYGTNAYSTDYPSVEKCYYSYMQLKIILRNSNSAFNVRLAVAMKKVATFSSSNLDDGWDHNPDHPYSQLWNVFWSKNLSYAGKYVVGVDINTTDYRNQEINLYFPWRKLMQSPTYASATSEAQWTQGIANEEVPVLFIDTDDPSLADGQPVVQADIYVRHCFYTLN